MIVPMKKLTILCMDLDQEKTLHALSDMGVLHLEHIQPPTGESVDEAKAQFSRVKRVFDALPKESDASPSGKSAEETVELVSSILGKHKELQARLDALSMEEKRIQGFGSFDPALIKQLAEKDIIVKLYKLGAKDEIEVPEGVAQTILNETKDGRYVALIGHGDFKVPFTEFRLPDQTLNLLEQEKSDIEKQFEDGHAKIQALGAERDDVQACLLEAEDHWDYAQAEAGMGEDEKIVFLRGFCPDEAIGKIREASAEYGWGLVINEPTPEDRVPTEIRSPKWVKPIKAIFDITGIMPGYDEVDVSPVFLIALSIFFAMLVGDAGYGAVFLGLTWLARKKLPKAPAYPFLFMYIMSICTVVWGVLTGTYFGITKSAVIVPYSQWLQDDNHVMFLCFLIGAIHLSVAHLWNAWLLRKTPQALSHIGWVLSTWSMFFIARMFVLGADLPSFVIWLFCLGLILIVGFMTPLKRVKSEWFNHVMLPLTVINNFTDVVSYLRLFAVGTASFAVANSFNQMLFADGWGSIWAGAIKAILLFAGHALNVALCGLGILVHGVRLNTLEYSSHMGLQWKGHKYNPFRRKSSSQ